MMSVMPGSGFEEALERLDIGLVLLAAHTSEQRSEEPEDPLRLDVGYQCETGAPANVLESVSARTRVRALS